MEDHHSFLYTVCTPKSVCYFRDLVPMLEIPIIVRSLLFYILGRNNFVIFYKQIIVSYRSYCNCFVVFFDPSFLFSSCLCPKAHFFFILHILKHSDLITGVSCKVLDLTFARSNSVESHSKILMQIQSLLSLLWSAHSGFFPIDQQPPPKKKKLTNKIVYCKSSVFKNSLS